MAILTKRISNHAMNVYFTIDNSVTGETLDSNDRVTHIGQFVVLPNMGRVGFHPNVPVVGLAYQTIFDIDDMQSIVYQMVEEQNYLIEISRSDGKDWWFRLK